jgi:hypothetical protein
MFSLYLTPLQQTLQNFTLYLISGLLFNSVTCGPHNLIHKTTTSSFCYPSMAAWPQEHTIAAAEANRPAPLAPPPCRLAQLTPPPYAPRANRPAPLAPPPRCFAQLAPLAHDACSTTPRRRFCRSGSRPPGDAARSTAPRHPFCQSGSLPPQGRHTLSEPALCQDGCS